MSAQNVSPSNDQVANFSNKTAINTNTDNSNNASTLGNAAQGTALSASDGGTLNYNGSDYGAIAGATSAFGQAEQLAAEVVQSNTGLTRTLAKEAEDTVQQQGAGALSVITKPFIWIAAIVGVVIVAGIFLWKRVAG